MNGNRARTRRRFLLVCVVNAHSHLHAFVRFLTCVLQELVVTSLTVCLVTEKVCETTIKTESKWEEKVGEEG